MSDPTIGDFLEEQAKAALAEARRLAAATFPELRDKPFPRLDELPSWLTDIFNRMATADTPRCEHLRKRPAQPWWAYVWEGTWRCKRCVQTHAAEMKSQFYRTGVWNPHLGEREEFTCDRCRTYAGKTLVPMVARIDIWFLSLSLCDSCTEKAQSEGGVVFGPDGEVETEQKPKPAKLGRNDPCHCGSGRKYKRCCMEGARRPIESLAEMKAQHAAAMEHPPKRIDAPGIADGYDVYVRGPGLFIIPQLREGQHPDLRRAIRARRSVSLDGRCCVCGAISNPKKGGQPGVFDGPTLHEHDCPAGQDVVDELVKLHGETFLVGRRLDDDEVAL